MFPKASVAVEVSSRLSYVAPAAGQRDFADNTNRTAANYCACFLTQTLFLGLVQLTFPHKGPSLFDAENTTPSSALLAIILRQRLTACTYGMIVVALGLLVVLSPEAPCAPNSTKSLSMMPARSRRGYADGSKRWSWVSKLSSTCCWDDLLH